MNIDQLVYQANFATGPEQAQAHLDIWNQALKQNIIPCSLAQLYIARGKGAAPHNFTVPAFNLRGLTYQTAQAAFRAAQKLNVGLFIFELARSEMIYTAQPPAVYVSNILAGAIKSDWHRPVFIQGDHFQTKALSPGQVKPGEVESLKTLIIEAMAAGFYNIDIDASTLVNLAPKSIYEQQRANFEVAAELATFIRQNQPTGITISLGGEIGEVGKANSKPEELIAFMQGFQEKFGTDQIGLSKVAIQTGTSHGGVVGPQGQVIMANVDFRTLLTLSQLARNRYGMAGAVQHGASTLPIELFNEFPRKETAEIHLATGFQNDIFDHVSFPDHLKEKMYRWGESHLQAEKKPGQTTRQFQYQTRKKMWGPFKRQLWELEDKVINNITQGLEKKFTEYYKRLGVVNSNGLVDQWIKPIKIEKSLNDYLKISSPPVDEVTGLAD